MIYKKHNRFDYTAIENIKQDQNDENLRNMKKSSSFYAKYKPFYLATICKAKWILKCLYKI